MKKLRIAGIVLLSILTLVVSIILIVILNRPISVEDGMSILDMLNSKIVYALYIFGALLFLSIFILVIVTLTAVIKGTIGTPETFERSQGGGGSRSGHRPLRGKGRFSMLTGIDKERMKGKRGKRSFEKEPTLEEICRNFRNFAAGEMGLYYSVEDIRRFIAGLGVSKLIIMQGMSGTGKTSLAYAFGKFIENDSVIIPIQPMWKERADMIGYFNEFTGKFTETLLLRKLYEASYSEEMYVAVLDEMNISRVEYYFSEFLSLLELPDPKERYMEVVSDTAKDDPLLFREGRMLLPNNMWFIGTANNDDSTFAISDKVYDRAMIMNLDRRAAPFKPEKGRTMRVSAKQFAALAAEAETRFPLSAEGRRKIAALDEYLIDHLHVTFGNRIMRQTEEYTALICACGGKENDAIDDILCKKILRKLEAQNPVFVRSEIQGVCDKIDELFGAGQLPLCRAYLEHFNFLN